jgi:hypothetical protein
MLHEALPALPAKIFYFFCLEAAWQLLRFRAA